MDKLEAGKGLFLWYNKLPGIAKTIMSLFVMITAPAIFIIVVEIRNPKVVTNVEFEKKVMQQMDDMQRQITSESLASHRNFMMINQAVDSMAGYQVAMETTLRDLSIVILANSNDDLFRRIVPYLDRIEDNTYKTIIMLQKREVLKKLDSARIEIRKKY